MCGRPALTVVLAAGDAEILQKLLRCWRTEARVARRARILLLRAAGKTVEEVAVFVGQSPSAVRRLGNRYRQRGLEAVYDAPRSGRPSVITPLQRVQIENLACTDPAAMGRQLTHWSSRTLRQAVIERGIVPSIHYTTVAEILRHADLHPHRHRSWKSTAWEPEAIREAGAILDHYEKNCVSSPGPCRALPG